MFRSLTATTTAGFLLLPLTVPEVGRLPWALVGQKVPSPAALYCPYGADDTSDAPGALMGVGEPTNRVVNPGCSSNCQAAEHCWDPVGHAIVTYGYLFDRLIQARQGEV